MGRPASAAGARPVINVPLTVPVSDGPIARTYLIRMKRAGLRPEAIVLLVYSDHPGTRKPVAAWLPGGLRRWYAEKNQEIALNFWPRRLRRLNPALFGSIVKTLKEITDEPDTLLDEMLGRFRYSDYSDNFKRVLVRDLRSDALPQVLTSMEQPTVLFTGGGIVPTSLLSLPGIKFLHVHPGRLPNIRGADGILWSTLVRGGPSTSCFYMAADIDTGPVIDINDFQPVAFKIPHDDRPDDQTLYRALFSYYDPILRSEALLKVLRESDNLNSVATIEQDLTVGINYHFMHEALRREALARLFVDE